MATSRNADLPILESREAYFDLFDGLSVDAPDNLEKRRVPGGLVKSYLLETIGPASAPESFEAIFRRSELGCDAIGDRDEGDEGIYRITDQSGNGIALAEKFDDRYFALYTLLPSDRSDAFVHKAVSMNPMLDHLWLSSQTFSALWAHIRSVNDGRRYGRITFEHESLFDVPEELEEFEFDRERRASRFTMVDQLDVMARQMAPLQETYAPLHSITHLRIPAVGRGGHDLYYDGKVTNRSDSFLDHRNTLRFVVGVYSGLTSKVEDRLWFFDSDLEGGGLELHGSIAELVFSEPLSEPTFRRWVMTLFNKRKNRFRISGFHTWHGARKVHANAIDQHLWQPLILELTPNGVLAVLPKGTCGNTVNRLITNIQRFVDPNVQAYIGDSNYSDLVPAPGAVQVAC